MLLLVIFQEATCLVLGQLGAVGGTFGVWLFSQTVSFDEVIVLKVIYCSFKFRHRITWLGLKENIVIFQPKLYFFELLWANKGTLTLGPVILFRAKARLSPLPCWPALTLLQAQLCLSMITTCNKVITLGEHNFTDFVANFESFCSNTVAHIRKFIKYAMQQLELKILEPIWIRE